MRCISQPHQQQFATVLTYPRHSTGQHVSHAYPQGKHFFRNEIKPELLTLRAGHTSTETTTSPGTGDIGSVVTTVGQGHLGPRTLDTAHNHIVSADVSVPVPGFLGRKAEKGISHTLQCLVYCWGTIHPPVTCILPPGKIEARPHTITETDLAKDAGEETSNSGNEPKSV